MHVHRQGVLTPLHIVVGTLIAASSAMPAPAGPRTLQPDDLEALKWRSIGPANMGGRVAAIALAPGNPKTFYVGYGTGGLWKTTNNGTTYSPIFDEEATASIGSVAVCVLLSKAQANAATLSP